MTQDSNVIIFSGPHCAHCEQAKALLEEHDIAFDERNIESSEEHKQDLLARLPQVRALPQLFVNDVSIGSTEDLQLLVRDGRLQALLDGSGIS